MVQLDPALVAQPLAFYDQQAVVDRDPEVLAARLAQHYSLLDFGPRPGTERSFLHRSVTAAAGDLMLTCGYTSPIQGTIGEREGVGSLNLCCLGAATYHIERQEWRITNRQPLFFAPGQEYRYSVDQFNGLAFHLDLARLSATAAAIAGLGASPRRFEAELEAPRVLALEAGRRERLLRLLHREFALLDDPSLEGTPELSHLSLDDLIYRTLALLLCPGLVEHEALARHRGDIQNLRERQFEQLLEWIRAHLEDPISLTVLEQRSGYSRRHLQQVFQQRFGCGPIQWVRQLRLEQARRALLNPAQSDSVAIIAARFGFRSTSVFSRDFSGHFGLLPSDLLREGKRRYT
jgi:AraC-like DNA-binding protein